MRVLDNNMELDARPRRNRRTAAIRGLARESSLQVSDLIQPLFLIEGESKRVPVDSMPGIDRLSIDLIVEEARVLSKLGINAVALFPSIDESLKDSKASESKNPKGLLQTCISALKKEVPEMCVISDVAMDPYSSDGHNGLVKDGAIINDETLPILADMAVAQAKAGADIVAPSDMMDGRVAYIREALDDAGFEDVGILAYSAKYCSAFYGPFRDALDSAPKAGDKKTYQMDPANVREALREVELDVVEGADMVMVKPALNYLDVITAVKRNVDVPVAAYNVSGEYAMVCAAAERGWMDRDQAMMEILTSIKRAGADIILSYFAKEAAKLLQAR